MRRVSIVSVIGAIIALLASVFASAPANADTDPQAVQVTIVASSFVDDDANVSFHNEQRLVIDGAHQLTWWFPNHNVKVSNKAIAKAPYIKVKYAPCAKQSKSIAKQAHGANIVVAKLGSKSCNTGKDGHIVGGFPWTVTQGPAVLKWNGHLKLYEHLFNLVQPQNVMPGDEVVGHIKFHGVSYKIVKLCKNRQGGPVDVMFDKVKQVRYADDVEMSASAEVATKSSAELTFHFVCPNGAEFNVKASAQGTGTASAVVNFTERTRLAVTNATKLNFVDETKVKAHASATSGAIAAIDVSAKCGTTVIIKMPPSVSASANACVQPGQATGVINVVVGNPNDANDTASVTVGSQNKSTPVNAGSTATLTFSGYAPGTYSVVATLVNAQKSATTQVTVNQCNVQQPSPCSLVSMEQPNDVLVGNTRTIKVTGVCPAGVTGTLMSTANIGSIANQDQSVSVSASWTVYLHYAAPTEGTSDTVTSKLFSNGHLDDQKSVTFGITTPTPDPPRQANR